MNTGFTLKRLLLLLLIGGLAVAPPTAAHSKPNGPAYPVAARQDPVQQDEDDSEGVTFDNLLPASSYTVYIEARNIGALLRSAEFRETFEPVSPMLEMMSGGMAEFFLVRLVADQADRLQHSRVMMAINPVDSSLPGPLLALELDSDDTAKEFETKLQEIFGKLAAKSNRQRADGVTATDQSKAAPAVIRRVGKLVVLSSTPFTFKALHGTSDARMSEDINFRAARDHFSAEPLFIYYDMALAEHRKAGAANLRPAAGDMSPAVVTPNPTAAQTVVATPGKPPVVAKFGAPSTTSESNRSKAPSRGAASQRPTTRRGPMTRQATVPQDISQADAPADQDPLGDMFGLLFSGEAKAQSNDALAVALALENDALVVRALLVSPPGAAIGPVPFLSLPIAGAGISSEAANYLPANTDIFAALSVDWARLYNLVAPQAQTRRGVLSNRPSPAQAEDFEARRAAFEKTNEVRLADWLAATLGNEIALSLPVAYLSSTRLGRLPLKTNGPPAAPLLLIHVRDREQLAPKLGALLEVIGLKPAGAKATTEKVGDIQITSFNNLAYAFIDDYLMITSHAAGIRGAIEARATHSTLGAARSDFQSYTQWQPRAPIAQVYISAAVLKGLFRDLTRGNEIKDDAAKEFLARYRFDPEPITYAASAEGIGARYELRIPRRVLMRFFSEIGASEIATRIPRNESIARGILQSIKEQEKAYKTEHGRYATLDEMEDIQMFREMIERFGYKLEVSVSDNGYEATMTPAEYGKTGRLSFYTDQSGGVREGDHAGKPASSSDKPVEQSREY